MRAFCAIRSQPHYRADAFRDGLRQVGFEVCDTEPPAVGPEDLLLIWNRYGHYDVAARRYESAGATVLVAENGYLGAGGVSPHSMQERDVYALAVGQHNGGQTPEGSADRWNALGIELQPWRADGSHVLVAPNRSFGTPGRIMPADWALRTSLELRALTQREIRIRVHPGNSAPTKAAAEDLQDCWAVVIWHSSFGLHALVAGIPVICLSPAWIGMEGAGRDLADIENPLMPERLPVMHKVASSQWTLQEIASGEAFRALL